MGELLSSLWNQQTSFTWLQVFFIAIAALLFNGIFCFANWFIRRETILECGYRKAGAKRMRKTMKQWSLISKILLRRLAAEATQSNPIIGWSVCLNYLNLFCGGMVIIGFICAIATKGTGWALILVSCPGIFALFFTTVVTFIPDLLWVPSERRRYQIRKKK